MPCEIFVDQAPTWPRTLLTQSLDRYVPFDPKQSGETSGVRHSPGQR
jgi:hypothetical protein